MESIFSLDFGNMPTCRATAAGSKKAPFTSPTETFKEMMLASFGFGMTKLGCVLRGRSTSLIIPLVREQLAQSLSGATMGSLTIKENGLETVFGQPGNSGPHVHLAVLDEQFWVRLMLVQDLGFAEAYMAGEVAVSSLVDFIRFYIYNRAVLDSSFSSPLVSSLMYLTNTRFINSVLNAASNISAHYDLGNEIFEMFLDSTMTYSCAVWKEPSDTLEKAQLRKLDMLIDKAHVCKDDYILDLGCGWGSLAMRAVERTGCRVLGITLSIEQKEAAERRIAQAGMSGHIEIMLVDYRNLDPTEYCFDKIISLEMVEHVGHEYLDIYFRQCSKLLNEHHGIMVLQASTMNEERYEQYRHTVDFINKYIFPGGHCPSVSALVAAATRGSDGFLMLESAANFPDHYARTLRAWRDRFLHGHDRIKYTAETKNIQPRLKECEPALITINGTAVETETPWSSCESSASSITEFDSTTDVTGGESKGFACHDKPSIPQFDSVFRRKWEYYFAYCEGAFATRTLGCTQLVFTRTYNEKLSSKILLS